MISQFYCIFCIILIKSFNFYVRISIFIKWDESSQPCLTLSWEFYVPKIYTKMIIIEEAGNKYKPRVCIIHTKVPKMKFQLVLVNPRVTLVRWENLQFLTTIYYKSFKNNNLLSSSFILFCSFPLVLLFNFLMFWDSISRPGSRWSRTQFVVWLASYSKISLSPEWWDYKYEPPC